MGKHKLMGEKPQPSSRLRPTCKLLRMTLKAFCRPAATSHLQSPAFPPHSSYLHTSFKTLLSCTSLLQPSMTVSQGSSSCNPQKPRSVWFMQKSDILAFETESGLPAWCPVMALPLWVLASSDLFSFSSRLTPCGNQMITSSSSLTSYP